MLGWRQVYSKLTSEFCILEFNILDINILGFNFPPIVFTSACLGSKSTYWC